jgi:hypothetical protein
MNSRQNGFSTGQMVLAVAVFVLVTILAIQFGAALDKTRISEAYRVADEPRLRIAEFVLLSDRFPSSAGELEAITGELQSLPDFVRDVVIEHAYRDHDLALKIYLDQELAHDAAREPPFVFVAGNRSASGGRSIEWSCGAHGVAPDLLPRDCVAVDG